ncbi:hypothetical protein E3P86_00471 [Wallemia ichthyophaga]|uniref:Phytocyanin domain-containing protein n=1 Tax=Wallemia ichthyophaga TaxID=245174 RepID=A0A4T0JHN6_WALIC|nr:hypothetical protein E3P86_00471 [Wallemia ichthyophaga]
MQLKYLITLATLAAFASANLVPHNVAYTKRSPQYEYDTAAPSPDSPSPSPAGPGDDIAICVNNCDSNAYKNNGINGSGGGIGAAGDYNAGGDIPGSNNPGNDNNENSPNIGDDDANDNNNRNDTAPSPTTKYVVVAPSQGVLRFVPFAMQADVGDKIQFTWMANNHGVTKSSMTGLCNATEDKPFKSPVQNATTTFEITVDTTDPMFYYCPVGNHCASGMYGMINPPMAPANLSNVGNAMSDWEKDSKNAIIMKNAGNLMKDANMTTEQLNWGSNWMDIASDKDQLSLLIENIITTRLAIALNPGWTPGAEIDTGKFNTPPDMNTLAESNTDDDETDDDPTTDSKDGGSSNDSGCIRKEAQITSLIFSLIAVFACVLEV